MKIGYTDGNVRLADGDWRLKLLAITGWILGVGFHCHGLPFGMDLTHPAYPVKEVPEGTCQQAGTF